MFLLFILINTEDADFITEGVKTTWKHTMIEGEAIHLQNVQMHKKVFPNSGVVETSNT